MIWRAGNSLWRARGFSLSLEFLHGSLRDKFLAIVFHFFFNLKFVNFGYNKTESGSASGRGFKRKPGFATRFLESGSATQNGFYEKARLFLAIDVSDYLFWLPMWRDSWCREVQRGSEPGAGSIRSSLEEGYTCSRYNRLCSPTSRLKTRSQQLATA